MNSRVETMVRATDQAPKVSAGVARAAVALTHFSGRSRPPHQGGALGWAASAEELETFCDRAGLGRAGGGFFIRPHELNKRGYAEPVPVWVVKSPLDVLAFGAACSMLKGMTVVRVRNPFVAREGSQFLFYEHHMAKTATETAAMQAVWVVVMPEVEAEIQTLELIEQFQPTTWLVHTNLTGSALICHAAATVGAAYRTSVSIEKAKSTSPGLIDKSPS